MQLPDETPQFCLLDFGLDPQIHMGVLDQVVDLIGMKDPCMALIIFFEDNIGCELDVFLWWHELIIMLLPFKFLFKDRHSSISEQNIDKELVFSGWCAAIDSWL